MAQLRQSIVEVVFALDGRAGDVFQPGQNAIVGFLAESINHSPAVLGAGVDRLRVLDDWGQRNKAGLIEHGTVSHLIGQRHRAACAEALLGVPLGDARGELVAGVALD